MEIIRSTKVKIDIAPGIVNETVQSWTNACNYISQIAFDNSNISNPVRLHFLTYTQVRSQFCLSAQVTQNAIRQVSSKYAMLRKLKRLPKKPVKFRLNAVVLQGGKRGRDFSFLQDGLSIWTLQGRIKAVLFHGAPKLAEYFSSWQLGDARLFVTKNKVYISVSFKREITEVHKPNDAVIGVDRGINYIAVATDGKAARFFGGGHTKTVRNRYTQIRASMQSKLEERKKAHKDTRSIRRCLKLLSGREARFGRNINHVVTRRIIQFAQATGNPTIAIEKLDGIRNHRRSKEQRADLNRWSFYQWETFLRYKADDCAFDVIEVEARNTSKGCSHCGYISPNNRHHHNFLCLACRYQLHADLNASRNIRLRGILARQVLCQDEPPSIGSEAQSLDMGKLPALAGSN